MIKGRMKIFSLKQAIYEKSMNAFSIETGKNYDENKNENFSYKLKTFQAQNIQFYAEQILEPVKTFSRKN